MFLKKLMFLSEFLHKSPQISNTLLHITNDSCRRCCARWHQFLLRLPIFHNYLKSFLVLFQRRFLLHIMSRYLFGFSLPFSLCTIYTICLFSFHSSSFWSIFHDPFEYQCANKKRPISYTI